MIMHQWTPTSPIPTGPMETEKYTKQRLCLRWLKLIISATIPIILVTLFLLYYHQEKDFFNKFNVNREFHRQEDQHRFLLDRYFDEISNVLLKPRDQQVFDFIQSKTLVLLRSIDKKAKSDVLRFLYDQKLVETGQMNLAGADFHHVEMNCFGEILKIHLSGVFWSNGIFRNCRFSSSNFDGSILSESRFFNCSFYSSSFIETNFDKSYFESSTIFRSSFNGGSFVEADLLQMNIIQGNNFTGVDFYRSKLTNDQLQGKYHSIIPHDFHQARLPNGSFNMIDNRENLLVNGDAELECESVKQTSWITIYSNQTLTVENNANLSGTTNTWANCSFVINANIHLYQLVHLDEYSLMIDTQNAQMSFSASTTCEKPFFHLNLFRFDGILQQTKRDPIETVCGTPGENETIFCYVEAPWVLPSGIRKIRVEFGVESKENEFPCYFDNIILKLRPK